MVLLLYDAKVLEAQSICMKSFSILMIAFCGCVSIACSESDSPYTENNGTSGVGGTIVMEGGTGSAADGNPSGHGGIDASSLAIADGSAVLDGGDIGGFAGMLDLFDGSSVNFGGYDGSLIGSGGTSGVNTEIDGSREGSSGAEAGSDVSAGADAESSDSDRTDSECPHSGNIRYTLNREAPPTEDQLDAYRRLTTAMDEAVRYYNCYTDLDKQLWVNYNPSVPTAEANIDGWMSFGRDRNYMVLPTAMHEIAHTLGIGYYNFGSMTDSNGIWTGQNANTVLASIPNARDTQLHADSMHFWPYGLNYASEYENEDDLINHCRLVVAIRQDMGL